MPRVSRRLWVIGLLLVFAFPLAWFFFWPAPDPGQILAVECEFSQGYSLSSYSWDLKLDATGKGTYSLYGFRYKKRPSSISVPIAKLQQAIQDNALATLPSNLGERVPPDSPSVKMRIKTTKLDKTISLHWGDPGIFDIYHTRAYSLFFIIQSWIKPHAIRRKFIPVKGRLLINGQPAKSRIQITARESDALPEDTGKHAFTEANGDFQFSTVELGDGLLSGIYDITILWGHTDPRKTSYLGPDRLAKRYDQDHPWKKALIVEDNPVELGTIDLKVDLPAEIKDNDIDRFPNHSQSQPPPP